LDPSFSRIAIQYSPATVLLFRDYGSEYFYWHRWSYPGIGLVYQSAIHAGTIIL
jgi:hypothetical protein